MSYQVLLVLSWAFVCLRGDRKPMGGCGDNVEAVRGECFDKVFLGDCNLLFL